jgi:hypothetical protein
MKLVINVLTDNAEVASIEINELIEQLQESYLVLTSTPVFVWRNGLLDKVLLEGERQKDLSSSEVIEKTNTQLKGTVCELLLAIVDDENTQGLQRISENRFKVSKHFVEDILRTPLSSSTFFGFAPQHQSIRDSQTSHHIINLGVTDVRYTKFNGTNQTAVHYGSVRPGYRARPGQEGYEYQVLTDLILAEREEFINHLRDSEHSDIVVTFTEMGIEVGLEPIDLGDGTLLGPETFDDHSSEQKLAEDRSEHRSSMMGYS